MMSRVRELRKKLGLPVDGLAHIAGVSQRTIILWEKYGLAPRSEKTIEKIARALGVEPDELFADQPLFLPLGEILGKFERAASELGTTPEELMVELDSDPVDGGVSGV
jgi:transcriptional regulator with XRE-family HTH domain